jgi:nucleobase:cation symporter-1, NCS1 family
MYPIISGIFKVSPVDPEPLFHCAKHGVQRPSSGGVFLSIAVSNKIDSSLTNDDLAPTTPAQRTWGTYNYIALWFSMSMEITTYQLASSLIAKGMDWKQAVGTVLLGNLIVLVPMLLNAHAGAKYGIPFPVFIRAPFGVRGANIPAILRALVACGWFGIQTWIGGTAIHSMLLVLWPSIASAHWSGFASTASGF